MNYMQIRITIGQLYYFRKIIKTPLNLEVPEGSTVLDIIRILDEKYQEKIKNDGKDHRKDFLDDRIYSLLQLLWNPKTGQFYDDVGVEARTSYEDGSESIPIEQDITLPLPANSWVVLTPDAGC